MNKNIVIALGIFITITLSSAAWAETIGDAPVDFTTSPSTVMDAKVSAIAFTLTSASSKTDTANGIEYLMISLDGKIYQKKQANAGEVTSAPTAPTTLETAASTLTDGYSTKGSGS